MHAFILAGGFATRLWPLTEQRAKPLLPLAGKPILTHLVEKIPPSIPVTVSTNAAFEKGFLEWKHSLGRPDIEIAVEQTTSDDRKLGTNGAVAQWIEHTHLQEDLLLMTGDNYLGFSVDAFLGEGKVNHALLAAYDIGDLEMARRFGTVLTDASGKIVIGFEEKPKEPKTALVSTGCYLIPASSLSIIVEYSRDHPDHIGGIFEELLRQQIPVDCFTFREPWFDIGSFHSYLDAHRLLVAGNNIIAHTAQAQDTELQGSVTIGEGSTVTKTRLNDCMIFDRCRITDCELRDCIVDDDCVLEGVDLRGKMLRAGTVLRAH